MDHWQRKRRDRLTIAAMVVGALGVAVVLGPARDEQPVIPVEQLVQARSGGHEAEAVPLGPVGVEHAAMHELDARGQVTVPFAYSDGGFWVTYGDERPLGEDAERVLDASFEAKAPVWGDDATAFVQGCCEGSAPRIDVVLRPRAPRRVARNGYDRIAEIDVAAPRGRLLLGSNGDGAISDVVAVPAGRYRLRVSGHHSTVESTDERFRFELWPAARAARPLVLLPRP